MPGCRACKLGSRPRSAPASSCSSLGSGSSSFSRSCARQTGINDLASYSRVGFRLLYGLLLGRLSVATYQNVETINGFVGQEATSLGLLFRSSSTCPEPTRTELQALQRDYALSAIHEDWPANGCRVRSWSGSIAVSAMCG